MQLKGNTIEKPFDKRFVHFSRFDFHVFLMWFGMTFEHHDGTNGATHQTNPIENQWKKVATFFFGDFYEDVSND